MAPLVVLFVVTGAIRTAGWLFDVAVIDSWVVAVRVGLAAMFVVTAIAHFAQPRRDALIAMVPPTLPSAPLLVTVTGVLELAGAVGLLIPASAPVAAGCLAVLMVVMFPANIRAARSSGGIKTMPLPVRAVVQIVFVAACLVVVLA